MTQRFFSAAVARIAAHVATVCFLVVALLQVLLALGVLPVTMAWGGTQPILTTPLRLASVVAAVLLGALASAIRRRAGLVAGTRPSLPVKVLAWVITLSMACNTLANVTSSSTAEAVVFGPLSCALAVSCLLVAASRTDATDAQVHTSS